MTENADLENTLNLETTKGAVTIRLRPDLAPNHVARIKELARQSFYDGIVFHRVIDGFMAQSGDPTGTGTGGSGQKLKAEFSNEPHVRGVCSMARANDPELRRQPVLHLLRRRPVPRRAVHRLGRGDRRAWRPSTRSSAASRSTIPTRSSRCGSPPTLDTTGRAAHLLTAGPAGYRMAAMADTTPNTPPPDWRDMRRRSATSAGATASSAGRGARRLGIAGVILIALGVIFLAQNFGYPVPHNWWAIFILLPAFAAFAAAWSMYQQNGGEMSPPVTSALIAGLLLSGLAAIFLLGVDLGKFWPIILIVLGVGALLGGGRWRQNRPPP